MCDWGKLYILCVICCINCVWVELIVCFGCRRSRTGRERSGEEVDRRAVGCNRCYYYYLLVVVVVCIDVMVIFGFFCIVCCYCCNYCWDFGLVWTRSAAVVRNIYYLVDVCDVLSDDCGDYEDYCECDYCEVYGVCDCFYVYGDVDDCVCGDFDVFARSRVVRSIVVYRA